MNVLRLCGSWGGLSPPTRGSLATVAFASYGDRRGVYPRPRGGAVEDPRNCTWPAGLSPPTRGSHGWRVVVTHRAGSIPAHAGEPRWTDCRGTAPRVYPRPRGGARVARIRRWRPNTGLSPPTRGSPAKFPLAETASSGVYPRPRGGAHELPVRRTGPGGSIPAHAGEPRGKRITSSAIVSRSIPAHAGEPTAVPSLRSNALPVYPRPRGGAVSDLATRTILRGLSPPTRGSRQYDRHQDTVMGSIPAHAGEPGHRDTGAGPGGVYPRPRGGARPVIVRSRARSGHAVEPSVCLP